MSMDALRWAWPIHMPATQKVVLARLADMADESGVCWPSVARLVSDTGLSERSVQASLARLEAIQILRRDMQPGRSTRYRLAVGAVLADGPPPQEMHPRTTRTPAAGAPAPAGDAPYPRTSCTQNPQLTLTEPPTSLRDATPAAAGTAEPFDARKLVWTDGIATLMRLTGKPAGAARSLMGKLLSAAKDDCAAVLTALRECPDTRDPTAWLMGAAKARGNPRRSASEAIRDEWKLPTFADPSLLESDHDAGKLLQ
jgi:hypothetical protein